MQPRAVDVCFYHGNCHDGALAAAIIQQAAPAVVCVPAWWHALPSRAPSCAGKHVVFVDLTPCEAVLRAVMQVAASVLVIDHHPSAEPLLPLVPHVYDAAQCGASLAWAWAFGPDAPLPALVHYVRALDQFQWDDLLRVDPDAMRVSRAIEQLVKPNVRALAAALRGGAAFLADMRAAAPAVDRMVELHVDRALASVEYFGLADDTNNLVVAVVNAQHFANWISHRVHTTQPHVDVTWVWYRHGPRTSTCVSLRSPTAFNCGSYAAARGGGGHPNSAAFSVPETRDSSMWDHLSNHE